MGRKLPVINHESKGCWDFLLATSLTILTYLKRHVEAALRDVNRMELEELGNTQALYLVAQLC